MIKVKYKRIVCCSIYKKPTFYRKLFFSQHRSANQQLKLPDIRFSLTNRNSFLFSECWLYQTERGLLLLSALGGGLSLTDLRLCWLVLTALNHNTHLCFFDRQ